MVFYVKNELNRMNLEEESSSHGACSARLFPVFSLIFILSLSLSLSTYLQIVSFYQINFVFVFIFKILIVCEELIAKILI